MKLTCEPQDGDLLVPADAAALARNSSLTRRIATVAYPFKCCVVCGLQLEAGLQAAHLDQRPLNNEPDNLAWMCVTHHTMLDLGLYPVEAIKMMRNHWQVTEGVPDNSLRMKNAGPKSAATRRRNLQGSNPQEDLQGFNALPPV